ncbi:DUF2306 domain-containing protein [Cohnella caldifontis]|uniref:DUF2306 domain-containing protein n=1 Tax=Cohnella caldifontis TaxID=3027471 RepID=UPI0023EC976E|nr:DUF2306 domain-containing protein [Cohnella sp. YIM B05605]
MNGKLAYRIVVALAAVSVLWALLVHWFIDPGAAEFLSHKTGLRREIRLPVWLRVLDLHVAAACLAIAAGAMNFSGRLRRANRKLHRAAGYTYIFCVLAVCITSGYMAPYATGGRAAGIAFNLLNLLWIGITLTAFAHIRRLQVDLHRRWMVRSYVFCFTNVCIHALSAMFRGLFGLSYGTGYACGVIGTIVGLMLLAEAVIRLPPYPPKARADIPS